MTNEQIATVCKAIEELEARKMKYKELKTLFTEEAFNLFSLPIFECEHCKRKVCYDELVNADEMEVDEIVKGYATCEECSEVFSDEDEEVDENEKDSIYSLHLSDVFGNGYGLY